MGTHRISGKRVVAWAACLAVASIGISVLMLPSQREGDDPTPMSSETGGTLATRAPPEFLPPPVPLAEIMPDWEHCKVVELDQARELLAASRVRSLFQPHEGSVGMLLKNGNSVCFGQPFLDWVIGFARLNTPDDLPVMIME